MSLLLIMILAGGGVNAVPNNIGDNDVDSSNHENMDAANGPDVDRSIKILLCTVSVSGAVHELAREHYLRFKWYG